ncbi:putative NAD(P)-binding protein [Arcicella aurantiaca]|uniref:Putative NAD(P)-binding protein n=1 Tax=Arcicella aurantiaca TaxID=591202 RepID=A0A316DZZ8_9BACT|nr:NAD(P)H-binding protein [Arcicella aurantiaca]PWK22998.1 putative NAD(P)-binding protein [Arcicella aurantiaca]
MKTAIIIGATGLIGGELVEQILENPDYSKVVLLLRKPLGINHPKLIQEVINFDKPDASKIVGDDLFCAIGTTLAKAGSKEAQYKIDCTYPYEIGKIAKANGVKQYILVSSIGADANSSNFYLKTKGDLEQKIQDLGFENFVSLRPSFLLGDRKEFRLGEKIGIFLAKIISPLLLGGLKKYRGIEASKVAKSMQKLANQGLLGVHFVESDKI